MTSFWSKLFKQMGTKLTYSSAYHPQTYGSYEVLKIAGVVAYCLKLPPDSLVHPIFHASLLKKSVAPEVVSQPLIAELTEDWELKV